MKRLFCVFFFVLIANLSFAQESEPGVFDSIPPPFQLYKYAKDAYAFYNLLKMYEPIYMKSKRYQKTFWSAMGTACTLIGKYQMAHHYLDKRQKAKEITVLSSSELDDYTIVKASDFVQSLGDKHQAIFLNEAHHVPQHRAFIMQVLQPLYDKGFRYFALETLMASDDLLNERKFPVDASGRYTRETVYADMVRYSLEVGYTLIPYEKEGAKTTV